MRTCVISITGFSPDSSPSRETLKSAIDAVGACYLGPLCRGVTTHLLCRCASGAKVEAAAQWGEVPLLRAEWVLTSLREGKRAEEGDFPVEREEDLISTGDEEEVSLRDDGDDDGDEVKGDGNGSDGGNEVHGERNGNGDGGDDDGNCDDDDIESDHSVVLNNPANNGPVVPENHDSTMDDRIDMVDDHHVNTTSDNDRVNTNNETIHSHPNTTSDFIKEEDHIDPVNEDNPIQSINENNPVNPIDENTHTNTTHDQHDHSNTINENNDQHDHTHTSTDTISSTRRSEKRPTLPHVFLLSGDVPPDAPTIIARLGGTSLPARGPFAAGATHLLAGSLRRTEKFLGAVACGLWVVKPSFLTACEQAGDWVDESPFEWDEAAADSHIDPACIRRRRKEGGGVFRGAR